MLYSRHPHSQRYLLLIFSRAVCALREVAMNCVRLSSIYERVGERLDFFLPNACACFAMCSRRFQPSTKQETTAIDTSTLSEEPVPVLFPMVICAAVARFGVTLSRSTHACALREPGRSGSDRAAEIAPVHRPTPTGGGPARRPAYDLARGEYVGDSLRIHLAGAYTGHLEVADRQADHTRGNEQS